MKTISPWQFTAFRILFGAYLTLHFIQLIPWSAELFGKNGILPDPSLNPTAGLFPNPLNLPLPELAVTLFPALLAAFSLLFTLGIWRKVSAAILWFGFTALFHRNNLISNPSIPYIGLLLVLSLLIPSGEPCSSQPRNSDWEMPKWVFLTAWILMATGYSFSGLTKLSSPSWVDGSAMQHLLENPLARPGLAREVMLSLPDSILSLLTWSTLALELLFLPLALCRQSRPHIWLAMVTMHLGIIAVVDFADLSLGMLMIHLFTFDPAWLKPIGTGPRTIAFDGECLMCSRWIRLLATEDRANLLRFTPLQGKLGQEIRQTTHLQDSETILFKTTTHTFAKSTAILEILKTLGGHWRLIAIIGQLIPRPIRDATYSLIARHRHRFFQKTASCQIPDQHLKERLIS